MPTFRKGIYVVIPLLIAFFESINLYISYRFIAWRRNDTCDSRLNLFKSYILRAACSIVLCFIYLVCSFIVFSDVMVFMGDSIGHLFSAIISYYYATVCLRFTEQKVTQDIINQIRNRVSKQERIDEDEGQNESEQETNNDLKESYSMFMSFNPGNQEAIAKDEKADKKGKKVKFSKVNPVNAADNQSEGSQVSRGNFVMQK